MANIEHKNIVDPDIHEPKGVASASSGQVYMANGAGSGNYVTGLGGPWTFVEDSTYTTSSRLSITGGVKTKITIDAAGANTKTALAPSLWSTANNKIDLATHGAKVNDVYGIRLTFKAQTATGSSRIDFATEVPTTGIVLGESTLTFPKGTGVVNPYILYFPVVVADNNTVTNGFELYITPSANTDVFDFELLVTHLYRGS